MHNGGNWIYGLQVIHNRLFPEFAVLDNFQGLCGPRQGLVSREQGLEVRGQGLVNWSLRTRTFLEDNNTETNIACNIVMGTLLHGSRFEMWWMMAY